MIIEELPLFPLRAVLLPAGRIPLQIFEPRYLDLVSRCMKSDSGFGVLRITEGHEVIIAQGSTPPLTAEVGTLARIVDWDALPAGRLRITVEGSRRFRVHATRVQSDGLLWGSVEWLPEAEGAPLADEYLFSAETRNDENLIIIHNPQIAAVFMDEFIRVHSQAQKAK